MEPQGRARGRARGRIPTMEIQAPAVFSQHARTEDAVTAPGIPTLQAMGRSRGRALPQPSQQAGLVQPSALVALERQNVPQPTKIEFIKTRPENLIDKKGKVGQHIALMTNYFALRMNMPDFSIYQYHVTFNPEIDSKGKRLYLLKAQSETLKGYAFDGGLLLFSCNQYLLDPLQLVTECKDGSKVFVTLKFVQEVDKLSNNYLQVLNIVARKSLKHLGLVQIGRGYFDEKARVFLNNFNLELWPGYATSIRQHDGGILMCVEITTKVLRNESAFNVIQQLHHQHGANYELPLRDAILGAVVMTGYNNRTYRIDDIDFNASPVKSFQLKDGKSITYIDYYQERHGITIKNTSQPLLVSMAKERLPDGVEQKYIYLVPELCRLTGLTEDMRNNFQLMKAVNDQTRTVPTKRIDSLLKFAQRMLGKQEIKDELNNWNMQFNSNLVNIDGRVLPTEMIVQGTPDREIRYPAGANVDWTNNLRSNALLAHGNFERWVTIVPYNVEREAMQFIGQILQAARGMKINMCDPYVHKIKDDTIGEYIEAIENVLSRQTPDILVCMISNNRSDRYSAIKKKCLVERSVPTQVITKRSMANKNSLSIATKIAIQMTCKVGGAPWSCVIPLKDMMVCGFDATHDTLNKGKSFGGFVASLNSTFSRYFSKAFSHHNSSDVSNSMADALDEALNKFVKYHDGCLPKQIIFYRDGVGDGQIPFVLNNEVEAIKDLLTKRYQGSSYKLAYVIVSKRINSRLFTNNRQNPPPGTVCDQGITLPERYDFFIVSQSVRQGTVSPTSYNVIFDNTGLDPDKMQRLTYKMTHLYYNWSGTIKVPAPVQYAHKLATLVGQFLHREPQNELDELLYYL